jgi:hypothetical protein
MVSCLAFSPKTQSGYKEKELPTVSVTKLPRMNFSPSRRKKRRGKIKDTMETKRRSDNELNKDNKTYAK